LEAELEEAIREEQQQREAPVIEVTPDGDRLKEQHETTGETDNILGSASLICRKKEKQLTTVAIEVHSTRTNNVATNRVNILKIVDKHPQIFAPILERNPHFVEMLVHVLRFGVRVLEVSWIKEMKDWDAEDNRRVGRAMAPIMRIVETNDAAVDALRSNYLQLQILFDEVSGFNEFMLVIVDGLLRDNKFGMLFRERYVESNDIYLFSIFH